MNEAIVFDTHRFVRNLTASGFTKRQAEALADEQVQLFKAVRLGVASAPADLRRALGKFQTNIESEMERFQTGVEAKLDNLKADLLKWMFAALIVHGGVIVTLIELL